jgi:hypothetical protein
MDTTTGAHGTYSDEFVVRYYLTVTGDPVAARLAIINSDASSDELVEWARAIDPATLGAPADADGSPFLAVASNPATPRVVLEALARDRTTTLRPSPPDGGLLLVSSLRHRDIVADVADAIADADSDLAQTITSLIAAGFAGTVDELLDTAQAVLGLPAAAA